ncbi:MAG: ABC transporter permease [Acidimicrobiales bacterium]
MKVLAIAATNLRRFLRDRSNLFFVFVLPLGIVLLIGAQFGAGFEPRVGVVPADDPASVSGTVGESILRSLESNEEITVVDYGTEDDLLLAVERGSISAGVVIPSDIERSGVDGPPVEVGFIARSDGLGPQLRAVVAEAVAVASEPLDATRYVIEQGATEDEARAATSAAEGQVPKIDIEVRTAGESLFPANLGQFDIGASSQLVLFMFLTGLSGSAAVIQTRNLGVAGRMSGTPTSVGSIVAGEALGRFVIVLVQGLYIMAATTLAFRVDWGDPLGAAAVLVVFAMVGAGAALLFGTLFSNDQQAGSVGVVVGIGLAALGGSMLPLEFYGDGLRMVSRLTPHAWANDAFAELVRRDGTIADLLPQLGALACFAAVFLVLASWRMRRVLTA